MTSATARRFMGEYVGLYGKFWQDRAKEEAERLMSRDGIVVDEDGAAKWESNGSYLPIDVCEKLAFLGAKWLDVDATAYKRKKQTAEAVRCVRQNETDEEIAEMRAAFGVGTEVVNVLTGRRLVL